MRSATIATLDAESDAPASRKSLNCTSTPKPLPGTSDLLLRLATNIREQIADAPTPTSHLIDRQSALTENDDGKIRTKTGLQHIPADGSLSTIHAREHHARGRRDAANTRLQPHYRQAVTTTTPATSPESRSRLPFAPSRARPRAIPSSTMYDAGQGLPKTTPSPPMGA